MRIQHYSETVFCGQRIGDENFGVTCRPDLKEAAPNFSTESKLTNRKEIVVLFSNEQLRLSK
jgi:hypothetical protein